MKKILVLIISFSFVLSSLTACTNKESVNIDKEQLNQSDVQSVQHEFFELETQEAKQTTEPITQQTRLSNSCDKIVYTARDGTDYYELVVDKDINYPKNTYRFGVIKNNQWLVEMSTQSPFLNENNTWKSLEEFGADPLDYICFEYLGEGCFLYYVDFVSISINNSGIFYNPSTNVALPVWNMFFYNDSYENVVNNGQAIVASEPIIDSSKYFEWVLLNTISGETTALGGCFNDGYGVKKLQGISENLFMSYVQTGDLEYIAGFFDLNGELILDISEYISGYPDEESDYRFINGQCSFITRNDSGVEFRITIDKTGQILSSEQV